MPASRGRFEPIPKAHEQAMSEPDREIKRISEPDEMYGQAASPATATGLQQSPRRLSRRWPFFALAWLGLVAISAASHWTVWIAPAGALSADDAGPGMAIKCLANIFNVLCAPGWGIVNKLSGNWHTDSIGVAVLAASVSWTGWYAGFAVLCLIRSSLFRSRRNRSTPWNATRAAAPPIDRRGAGDGVQSDSRERGALHAGESAVCPSRRRFLFDGTLGLGCVSTLAVGVDATLIEPWDLRVTRYEIPIADLPAPLVGLKLVQLSDTHLGPRIPASFLRDAVAQTLALAPDIVLLTGDYVHNGPQWVEPAAKLFAPLVAPGRVVVGVLGNHDWWAGGQRVTDALTRVGVRMLDNTRCFYDPRSRSLVGDSTTPHGECLCISGVGDLKEDHVDFRAALAGVPDSMPRLMLAHRPDTAELPELHAPCPPRIDLMLCGHTHGGQVRLPILGTPMVPSRYGSKYAAGLVQGPACRVLISRGVGMSIVPVRFGVPPEIVEITLTRATAAPNNPA